ncbi:MAG: acetyl-CoA C-acyltransferase FadA [Halobacteriovoraceae bacterium]|nr:acetyl-CoA C-acyltransferase FadA [Halobacteriovoraceae bacterium]MCB9095457.1 acetyl-CoA C-acyltransferase FadA [Halobacteriovoraceae bacterium]
MSSKNIPVIVDAARTPMARSKGGAFRYVRAEDLTANLMDAILKRNPKIDPASIDDIIWGCVQQTLEQAYNLARNSQLLTQIPIEVPAQTINRLCGSSMTAIHSAAANIMAGLGEIYLCGGTEHMGHVPMTHGLDLNPRNQIKYAKAGNSMGLTAEYLGMLRQISREDQDKFSLRSHQRAHQARLSGRFDDEIVPIEGHDADGVKFKLDFDEVVRPDTSLETLLSLRPVFNPKGGTVTAGNSSAISDGSSAVIVMAESKAHELGMEPMARIVSQAAAGCDPAIMGIGPVPATKKALNKANLSIKDIDLVELNEAFAAQSLAVLKDLELLDVMDNKVNVNGGAIALGHPLGCSGARIITTLVHQMKKDNLKKGLATMCIGYGQGVATIIETY